jgi:hypothetical protein
MKLSKLVASGAIVAILPSAAQAQQVTVTQGPGICTGTPSNSYGWWVGIASGLGCGNEGLGGGASNVLEWTYLDGALPFNGFHFTGYGTFYLDLIDGENVLYTASFDSWGENVLITVPEFAGSVTGVRIRRQSGIGAFGIGEDGFIPPPVQKNGGGSGPQGNGPNGNNGNNGNNGIGPTGGGDDNDDPPYGDDGSLNALVNETNAAPEPATILLVASGLGGVGAMARRRRKQVKHS